MEAHTETSLTVFHDTAKKLLETLAAKYKHDSDGWPRSPKGLSEALKRQAPALQSLGIEITHGNKKERTATGGQGLTIKISKIGNVGNNGNIDSKIIPPEKKFTPLESAANADAELF